MRGKMLTIKTLEERNAMTVELGIDGRLYRIPGACNPPLAARGSD